MATALLLLRTQRVPFLQSINKLMPLGMNQWISEQDYNPIGTINTGNFSVEFTNNIAFASAVAGDLVRLGNAALETVSSISEHKVFKKSLCWPLIQAYYGSYFAAHALMRIHGSGVLRFEHGQIKQIQKFFSTMGLQDDGSLEPGYFFLDFDQNNRRVSFSFLGSNPHELLWKGFAKFLGLFSARIQQGPGLAKEKGELIAFVEELTVALSKTMPSVIRNNLNYRQEYGVWYPFSNYRANSHDDLMRILLRWGENPLLLAPICRQRVEVKRLAAISVCCVSLLREIMLDIESSGQRGRAFTSKKTTQFITALLSS